jgi:hypothetical protein
VVVLDDEERALVTIYDGTAFVLNFEDGSLRWLSFGGSTVTMLMRVDDRRVAMRRISSNDICVIDLETGEETCKFSGHHVTPCSAVVCTV